MSKEEFWEEVPTPPRVKVKMYMRRRKGGKRKTRVVKEHKRRG